MTVFASLSVSLDGYYTGPSPSPLHPLGHGGEPLYDWIAHNGKHQAGTDEVLAAQLDRLGALIMGRDSYEHAQAEWGEQPPFKVPTFVVTHRSHADDVRDGTTFHFVTDGFPVAIDRASAAAEGRDVGLHGGGPIRQALRCGVLTELQLHIVPTLLGSGRSLFESLGYGAIQFTQEDVAEGNGVTHVTYRTRYGHASGSAGSMFGY